MYNLIVKETEQEVLEHFNSLGIEGVGFETTTPNVIWHKIPHDYSQDYLTFVSKANNNTFLWKARSDENTRTISVSTDNGETWTDKTSSTGGTVLGVLNNGDKMLIKGNNTNYGDYDENWHNFFTSTGYYDVEGNIMSLIGGDNFTELTELVSGGTFYALFSIWEDTEEPSVSYLQSAGNLVLPATALTYGCYAYLLAYCTCLTSVPALPATTLTEECYDSMFEDCTNLTTAPELPATTLAYDCYEYMFRGCTNLTTAPELPATTLAEDCYYAMFKDCTSLTTAPELPATTLADSCYHGMFDDCTSLNYVKCLASSGMTSTNCLTIWLSGVASTGTFVKSPNATTGDTAGDSQWRINSANGIPSGWTVVDATS